MPEGAAFLFCNRNVVHLHENNRKVVHYLIALHFCSGGGLLLWRPAIVQWLTAFLYLAFNFFDRSFYGHLILKASES